MTDEDLIDFRNEELFPFLKDETIVDERTNQIMLTFDNTVRFVSLLITVVPELINLFGENALERIDRVLRTKMNPALWVRVKPVTPPPLEKQEVPPTILIRKDDFRLYKYDTRYKNIDKVLENNEADFLD